MSILAISGKKSSGKDTVGKIIQYLTGESTVYPFDLNIDYSHTSNWEVKKFADKLKDIIRLLINCNREQLEDESFKSKELGEEWWYFKGRNGSLIPYSEYSKRNDEDLIKPTPRFLLQFIGTDLLRNQLHPEIWVNSLMSEYKPLYGYQTTDSKITIGDISIPIPGLNIDKRIFPNWIITDTRFPNELKAVKDREGITIRVNRFMCSKCGNTDNFEGGNDLCNECGHFKSNDKEHESETALDSYNDWDYIIDNNGSIDELINSVRRILQAEFPYAQFNNNLKE